MVGVVLPAGFLDGVLAGTLIIAQPALGVLVL
jgi:hypothetical protein